MIVSALKEHRAPIQGHTFHIPVMGTGFTIDTPIRIAKYGVSSVISIVDDILIELMRKYHTERIGEPYFEIKDKEPDSRARRITAYLNLVDKLVARQVEDLKSSPFEPGSEITRYYELLPDGPLKQLYSRMLGCPDPEEKSRLEIELRALAEPGSIDVNIMTKLDRDTERNGDKMAPDSSDALAALRGFARSTLRSGVVFSAGLNQRLYAYAANFDDFFPGPDGSLVKRIILKVSDFRSAQIQGKFFAKRGLWVSEYRIESGLNCGGHAFATKGHLLGPILEEFKQSRGKLVEELHGLYREGLSGLGRSAPDAPLPTRITVQGGIGTSEEHEFMLQYYEVDAAGWATPFLLVPEVTNVDAETMAKLIAAQEGDVFLSESSPLGIPFWNLRTSASEDLRRRRILEGRPGSPCPKNFLVSNRDYTSMPICLASHSYQKRRLEGLETEDRPAEEKAAIREYILGKSCLCRDLSGGAEIKTGVEPSATPAICCGPNIVNFSKIATLEEMVSHIYGRLSLLTNPSRPHMFLRELKLYIDFLRREAEKCTLRLANHPGKYFAEYIEGLRTGIEYYRQLAEEFVGEARQKFLEQLQALELELDNTPVPELVPA
ncbi:MAG: hypothetical protein HUU16_05465 [Candidatus Omnitrophica bacterium]|nr:hypothetical protein [Candidatus Omnitrophota bacterium]